MLVQSPFFSCLACGREWVSGVNLRQIPTEKDGEFSETDKWVGVGFTAVSSCVSKSGIS